MPSDSKSNPEFKVVCFGEESTGKTCFTDVFMSGAPFVRHDPTKYALPRTIICSGEPTGITMTDYSSSYPTYPMTIDPNPDSGNFSFFTRSADGIVLLYDIMDRSSFDRVTTTAFHRLWTSRECRPRAEQQGHDHVVSIRRFGCIVVGTKADLVEKDPSKRQVSRAMAEQWAQSQGFRHYELNTRDKLQVWEAMQGLVKSIKVMKKRDAMDLEESGKGMSRLAKVVKGLSFSNTRKGGSGGSG